jgi:hypothetical protein
MTDTPWHFWPIVTIALLWHVVGALDYSAIQYDWRPWLNVMGTEQRLFVEGMPDWIDGSWAVSVWFGLLGALLLAGRVAFAPLVLAISMFGGILVAVWLTFLADPSILSLGGWIVLASLWITVVFSVLLWLYARDLHRQGVVA